MQWLEGLTLLWFAGAVFIVGAVFTATAICFFPNFISSYCILIDNEDTAVRHLRKSIKKQPPD